MTTTFRTPISRNETVSELTQVLRVAKERANMTQAEISRETLLDEGYISRLFSSGERSHPSFRTLILLAIGMRCNLEETDEILLAGGWAPLVSPRKYI
jgi:transcriptional regulator with XRE-family HTH domain